MKKPLKISKRILFVFLALLGVFFQSTLLWTTTKVSNSKSNISLKEGVLDFSDFSYGSSLVYPYGQFEFYYNQWIVTDNMPAPIMDAYIDMPFTWSGMTIVRNGKDYPLPEKGYASYRITMTNILAGKTFSIANQDYGDSMRIFFNDKLVYEYGVLSKNREENDISGKHHYESSFVVPKSGIIVMTIEVGNNGHGGLQEVPIIYPGSTSSRTSSISEALIFFAFGIILSSVLTALLFFCSNVKNLDYHYLILLTLILLLSAFFSEDGLVLCNRYFLYPNYFIFETLHFLFAALFIYALTFAKLITEKKIHGKSLFAIGIVFLTSVLSWFFLGNSAYRLVPYLTLSFPLIFFCIGFFPKKHAKTFLSILNLLTLSFTFGDIVFEITKFVRPYHFTSKGIVASVAAIRALIFLAYFITQYILLIKSKKEYLQLYQEKMQIKNNTLKEEIKPHYLFNMLSVIRYQYHKDARHGDEVMALFSRNFRQSLENMEQEMIPFEKEIETIGQYIELENYCSEKPFEVIFDLEFTGFSLPPLTIEPLVENSVNYSKVNEKEDGYILVSSVYEKGFITIIVEDNGIGYEKVAVRNNSIGQRNLIERLSISLNAKVTIESGIGTGTKTTITFPYQGEKEEEEEV